MSDPYNVLKGDKHGFIVYPASWGKKPSDAYRTVREITAEDFAKNTTPQTALQFELPRALGGSYTASPNQAASPAQHEHAASKLFSQDQHDFATFADDAARRYAGIGPDDHTAFTHLHGIGSWENAVEPSMMTVFHKPITALQLQKVGADVGSWARQHGILVFSPHPEGQEKLMHMRIPTHHAMNNNSRLDPRTVAEISHRIHNMFNEYRDPHMNESLMPGRTILPDPTGHSDVLVWLPPWERNPERIHSAFNEIGDRLGARGATQYWPGTGMLLGGTSPYSDEEAAAMPDARKRDAAIANYARVLQALTTPLPNPQATQPTRFAAIHAPAGVGAVVRGVHYAPGAIIPTPEPAPQNAPEATPAEAVPMVPMVPMLPPNAGQHPAAIHWKKRIMDAYNRRKLKDQNAVPHA